MVSTWIVYWRVIVVMSADHVTVQDTVITSCENDCVTHVFGAAVPSIGVHVQKTSIGVVYQPTAHWVVLTLDMHQGVTLSPQAGAAVAKHVPSTSPSAATRAREPAVKAQVAPRRHFRTGPAASATSRSLRRARAARSR